MCVSALQGCVDDVQPGVVLRYLLLQWAVLTRTSWSTCWCSYLIQAANKDGAKEKKNQMAWSIRWEISNMASAQQHSQICVDAFVGAAEGDCSSLWVAALFWWIKETLQHKKPGNKYLVCFLIKVTVQTLVLCFSLSLYLLLGNMFQTLLKKINPKSTFFADKLSKQSI